jgi:hypothetical protein
MKKILLIAAALALLPAGRAQFAPSAMNLSTRSVSGQFMVRSSVVPDDNTRVAILLKNANCVQLTPSTLVVSCERIKEILWRKLNQSPSWRGRIFLDLRPARSDAETVTIVSERFADGWQYGVEIPDVMEREIYVRAIVQALLVEIVNRNNTDLRSTEIPLWFVAGISREIIVGNEKEIIIEPPNPTGLGINENARRPNSLERAREILGAYPPLTFDQLSWPANDQLSGGDSEIYQCSAQLFVNRLLRFKDGAACFRAMLGDLPAHLNWQLAFLGAFKSHFSRTLDVEKWWAVQIAEFTGRDLTQMWSPSVSWEKLDEIIRPPAKVRTAGNQLPIRTEVNLQTLLRDSNGIQQTQFYREKLNELDALRLRVSQDLVGLVDEYRAAISTYVRRQSTTVPFLPLGKQGALVTNPAADELIRQLNALDVKRNALRPPPPKPVVENSENISGSFRE